MHYRIVYGLNIAGDWQIIAYGWEENDPTVNPATAPMYFAKSGRPVFEWLWDATAQRWTSRSFGI